MELYRQGIEVSHSGGALIQRVPPPPAKTRPLWSEVARFKMWMEKRKTVHRGRLSDREK